MSDLQLMHVYVKGQEFWRAQSFLSANRGHWDLIVGAKSIYPFRGWDLLIIGDAKSPTPTRCQPGTDFFTIAIDDLSVNVQQLTDQAERLGYAQ